MHNHFWPMWGFGAAIWVQMASEAWSIQKFQRKCHNGVGMSVFTMLFPNDSEFFWIFVIAFAFEFLSCLSRDVIYDFKSNLGKPCTQKAKTGLPRTFSENLLFIGNELIIQPLGPFSAYFIFLKVVSVSCFTSDDNVNMRPVKYSLNLLFDQSKSFNLTKWPYLFGQHSALSLTHSILNAKQQGGSLFLRPNHDCYVKWTSCST